VSIELGIEMYRAPPKEEEIRQRRLGFGDLNIVPSMLVP